MSTAQALAGGLLILAIALFAWGRWRHDVVALAVLMLAVLCGLVPPAEAFLGFGHPAVVTVGAVLLLSRALETTGVIGAIARFASPRGPSVFVQVATFSALAAIMSAFVNNVGALAMLMPLAIASARRHNVHPGAVLMPVSFATMLGGMTTLIGTPPNIIVSSYRAETAGAPFALFDFAPVGATITLLGLIFLAVIGWRLIPSRRAPPQTFEGVEEYVAELHVGAEAALIGETTQKVAGLLEERDVTLLGVLRKNQWTPAVSSWTGIAQDDVLLVEGSPESLANLQGWNGASLGKPPSPGERLHPPGTALAEVVLRPASTPVGSTPEELRMRSRYLVNLLGVSRQGARHFSSLKSFRFASGDVLLLQGEPDDLAEAIAVFDALPLGDRALVIHDRRAAAIALVSFTAALLAIGLVGASPAIALGTAAVVLLLTRVVPPRNAYRALDGAVLVLLAALLPVGQSLEATGVTTLIGDALIAMTLGQSAYVSLALVIIITMCLSDVINNAATAVVMAPIAATVAAALGVSADPFLMAVAIGASCAFLTPIGHQNNLLVMGPGGYRFGDYWRLGLPLEIMIAAAATLLLPEVWPFAR